MKIRFMLIIAFFLSATPMFAKTVHIYCDKDTPQIVFGAQELKAALNDEFRRRAAEWGRQGVLAVVIHPGWVRTDMGGASADLSVAESTSGVRALLAELTIDQHGRFWTWDGREHPW